MRKLFPVTALVATVLVGTTNAAYAAQGLGEIFRNMKSQFGAGVDFAGMIALLMGVVFAVSAVVKLRQHGQNPQQQPLGPAIWTGIAAILLIAIPLALGVGTQTIFGTTGGALTTSNTTIEIR